MQNSRYIARLVGPTLIVMNVAEAINAHIWANNIAAGVFLAGNLWLVAGLSIVRAHNVWIRSWPVLLTLVGWFAILGGIFRMFFPEAQQGAQNTFAVQTGTYAVQTVLFAIGVVLTFNAYSRKSGGK